MHFTSDQIPYLVIIGPSGVGKSTVVRQLHREQIITINPTWTTRAPREDEQDEIEHHFASEEEFETKKIAGFFVDTAQLFGLPYSYGLPTLQPSSLSRPSLVMLRATLLAPFQQRYPHTVIYHIEDTIDRIKERLDTRVIHGESPGSRLDDYRSEVELGRKVAHRIFINTDKDDLFNNIRRSIVEDFLSRAPRCAPMQPTSHPKL